MPNMALQVKFMKAENIEIGIQRIYYVLWGGLVALNTVLCIRAFNYESESEFLEGIIGLGLAVLIPYIGMLVGRWIYRGFRPKSKQ